MTAESKADFVTFSVEEDIPDEEQETVGLIQSLLSAPLRGALKTGLSIFGGSAPVTDEFGRPVSIQEQQLRVDELLPVQEGVTSRFLERTGQLLAPIPGASVARVPLAAALGQTAEELGGGEIAQLTAELVGFGLPSLTTRITPTKAQKELVEFGKRQKLTDRQIAPLLQSDKRQRFLGKLAGKGKKVQQRIETTRKGISEIYGRLRSSEAAKLTLRGDRAVEVADDVSKILLDVPSGVRKVIAQDFQQFVSKPITGNSIIKFWQDINHNLGPKTKQLSRLKEPLLQGLQQIDPVLAQDFQLANDVFGKFAKISQTLKPQLFDQLLDVSKVLTGATGLFTGYTPLIAETVSLSASRKIAAEMLTNPRYQNLGLKMINALNANKATAAFRIMGEISDEVRKIDPDFADQLDTLTVEDFKAVLK